MSELERVAELEPGQWARGPNSSGQRFGVRASTTEIALEPVDTDQQSARHDVLGMRGETLAEQRLGLDVPAAVGEHDRLPEDVRSCRAAGKREKEPQGRYERTAHGAMVLIRSRMSNSEVSRVVIMGAGQMGAGIAQVCAGAGIAVSLADVSAERAAEGKARIERQLTRLAEKGKTTVEANRELLARITPSATGAFATADAAIEAATEERGVKAKLLREASAALPEHALLLSNTSSISLTWLAAQTSRPERVAGMHFMNPVPLMQLVEVVHGLQTSGETAARVAAFAVRLGKTVITSQDRPGFIVNRMLIPFLNEACFALEEGIGSAPDIDAGARLGLNHPLGPLELADLIGLDTVLFIAEILHRDLGDDKYRPASGLRNLVAAGWLGKKSGRGFYRYDAQGNRLEPSIPSWSTA